MAGTLHLENPFGAPLSEEMKQRPTYRYSKRRSNTHENMNRHAVVRACEFQIKRGTDTAHPTDLFALPYVTIFLPPVKVACDGGEGVLDVAGDGLHQVHHFRISRDIREEGEDEWLILAINFLRRRILATSVQPTHKQLRSAHRHIQYTSGAHVTLTVAVIVQLS